MSGRPQFRWSPSVRKSIEVEHLNPEPNPQPRRQWKRNFVQVPWFWAGRLRQAKHVGTFKLAFWLLYEWWSKNDGQPITVSNIKAREEAKVPPRSKSRALTELRELDLITVERQQPRSPRVVLKHADTLLTRTKHGPRMAQEH